MGVVAPGYILPRDAAEEFGFQAAEANKAPAAGSPFQRKTKGAFYEIPLVILTTLVTSATVANRTVSIVLNDGDGNALDEVRSSLVQAASLSVNYRWSVNLSSPYSVGGNYSAMPMTGFLYLPGYTLFVTANNLQAGDQFQAIQLVLQQFNTGVERELAKLIEPIEASTLGLVLQPSVGPVAPAPAVSSPTVTAPAPAPAPAPATTTAALAPTSSTDLGSGSSAGSGPGVSRL